MSAVVSDDAVEIIRAQGERLALQSAEIARLTAQLATVAAVLAWIRKVPEDVLDDLFDAGRLDSFR